MCGRDSENHSVTRTDLAQKLVFTAEAAGDDTVIYEITTKSMRAETLSYTFSKKCLVGD